MIVHACKKGLRGFIVAQAYDLSRKSCDRMSAWFILASIGLHQACPGDTRYELFTPLFDKVSMRIDPIYGTDKIFTILAHNNGPGARYIQSAKLNGKPLDRCWLDHKEIVAGGLLEQELAPTPNKTWGVTP